MTRRTLDRFLSRAGVASRTRAAALVGDGRVGVNGRLVFDPATWIDTEHDVVTVDGKAVAPRIVRRVVLLNKPRGVVTTLHDPEGRPTIADALGEPFRRDTSLRPVGRLDQASAGLVLFTNDNDLGARLLEKSRRVPKVYRVKLRPPPGSHDLARLEQGVDIGDPSLARAESVEVERAGEKSVVLRWTLTEGRNRQIRRMCEAVGSEVEWLVRVAFGPVLLGGLDPGEAREASSEEMAALLRAAGMISDRGG